MGKHTGRGAVLLVALGLLTAGCAKEDQDRLQAVGRRIGEKMKTFQGQSRDKVTLCWPANGILGESAPISARVQARLRWEKELTGANIEVSAEGDTVVLTGTVLTLDQGRRARDLAQTTLGVEKVDADGLTVAGQKN